MKEQKQQFEDIFKPMSIEERIERIPEHWRDICLFFNSFTSIDIFTVTEDRINFDLTDGGDVFERTAKYLRLKFMLDKHYAPFISQCREYNAYDFKFNGQVGSLRHNKLCRNLTWIIFNKDRGPDTKEWIN